MSQYVAGGHSNGQLHLQQQRGLYAFLHLPQSILPDPSPVRHHSLRLPFRDAFHTIRRPSHCGGTKPESASVTCARATAAPTGLTTEAGPNEHGESGKELRQKCCRLAAKKCIVVAQSAVLLAITCARALHSELVSMQQYVLSLTLQSRTGLMRMLPRILLSFSCQTYGSILCS